ncbi:MAG: nucleotidyl transferase AbiEii/AbiGii toxin family protein [Candidatus Paceibacterota bacterium]|jgi:predicted nucleotidyltransferase component of viral defense system|nr:nucleotidyl transferase AbiEii/AbiGii toxin family protein [Candidatus Paceibacterota bacterium]MDD4874871.1 nucleotidyl transferase AbiEii/AbiGii toxin family protein [Candidatus Paceibacterota bacterium]
MFYNILDKKRLETLPLLKNFKDGYYLAGETGLALQLGRRDSIDFDFFSQKEINTEKLFSLIKEVFNGRRITKVQEEKNSLTVFIDENIKLSFFSYKYRLIDALVKEKDLNIASVMDIACMKLAAIVSRASNKDYIDLYFILKRFSLKEILNKMNEKMPDLDANLVLKSLVFFKDVDQEPIKFHNNNETDFETIKNFLIKEVSSLT